MNKLIVILTIFSLVFTKGDINMVDYNIQMGQRNTENTEWDNHYPITKDFNIKMSNGGTLKTIVDSLGAIRLIKEKISPPSGFLWQNSPIQIQKNSIGEFTTDFDVSSYEITGKTYYVNSVTGNNANNGLTPETAFKDVRYAAAKTDVDVVIIAEGEYRYGGSSGIGSGEIIVTRNISIKAAENAKVTLSFAPNVAWTLVSGKTNTYQINRTNTGNVYDSKFIDEFGDYKELTLKSSIDEVEINQGSWYTDGTMVYVHSFDSRPCDSKIMPFLKALNCVKITDVNIYLEGINFEGGNAVLYASSANGYVAAKNCSFKYATLDNGIRIIGYDNAYFQNCEVARSYDDGFSYHILNSVIANVIEVDCIGRHNGKLGDIDNGSTMHDAGKIIRVNGVYHNNVGSNVGDINLGTESWNVGCASYDSDAVSQYKSNFTAHTDAKMWIENCASAKSLNALIIQNGATIYYKNSYIDGEIAVEGTGQLIAY